MGARGEYNEYDSLWITGGSPTGTLTKGTHAHSATRRTQTSPPHAVTSQGLSMAVRNRTAKAAFWGWEVQLWRAVTTDHTSICWKISSQPWPTCILRNRMPVCPRMPVDIRRQPVSTDTTGLSYSRSKLFISVNLNNQVSYTKFSSQAKARATTTSPNERRGSRCSGGGLST